MPLFYLSVGLAGAAPQQSGIKDDRAVVMQSWAKTIISLDHKITAGCSPVARRQLAWAFKWKEQDILTQDLSQAENGTGPVLNLQNWSPNFHGS